MIQKPSAEWRFGEDALVRRLQNATDYAKGGIKVARSGGHFARGLVCWFFAILWGFAALAGGLFAGSLPTFLGVGAMAAFVAWGGRRAFSKARETLS
jgi:hypothetical protein